MDMSVSQPQVLQPMWKEAVLICQVPADPCHLPVPHFVLAEQPTRRIPSRLKQLLQLARRPWT